MGNHNPLQVGTPKFDRLTAEDLMEREVQTGQLDAKGDVLGSLMIEGFGGVPIVDQTRRLKGIVTEFDLLAALDTGANLGDLMAKDMMTEEVVSVSPHTEVRTLIYVLQTNHLIRVPVVNQDGQLIGIVARRDVVQGYLNP